MLSDFELWERWREGDTVAGTSLVERHFLAAYRFFTTKLPDAADDLAQATFAACIESHNTFRAEASFRSFVLGIARKMLLRHLEGRGQVMNGRAVSEVSLADMVPSPSSVAAHAERRELLIEAMRTIPLQFQLVLELHYWEELDTAAIAEVLEVPQGTVKSRLSRARGHLKEALATRVPQGAGETLADEFAAALRR